MATGDLIVGVGSPHGDDAVGWLAVERLAGKLDEPVHCVAIQEPVELTFHLEGCRRLWIVDGCSSGRPPGSVLRLVWPDQRVQYTTSPSSHGVNVEAALRLAETLGRLPDSVVIYTIEVADVRPGAAISEAAASALATVERRLTTEVNS